MRSARVGGGFAEAPMAQQSEAHPFISSRGIRAATINHTEGDRRQPPEVGAGWATLTATANTIDRKVGGGGY